MNTTIQVTIPGLNTTGVLNNMIQALISAISNGNLLPSSLQPIGTILTTASSSSLTFSWLLIIPNPNVLTTSITTKSPLSTITNFQSTVLSDTTFTTTLNGLSTTTMIKNQTYAETTFNNLASITIPDNLDITLNNLVSLNITKRKKRSVQYGINVTNLENNVNFLILLI